MNANELQNDGPTESNEQVYEIEKVLKTRKRGGQKQYLVKWLGYPSEQNSWALERDVVTPTDQEVAIIDTRA